MYTVTSGVTEPKYCGGTFLAGREISAILGSQFIKLIRRLFGHLLFTTNKLISTFNPTNGAVTTTNFDPSKLRYIANRSQIRCRPLMFLSSPVSKQSKHIEATSAITCTYRHIKISLNPRPSGARRYLFRYILRVSYDVILQSMYCNSIGTLLHFRRYLDPPDPNMATSSRPGTIIPRTKNNSCWIPWFPVQGHFPSRSV